MSRQGPRHAALLAGQQKYENPKCPCKKCGSIEKYTVNYRCVNCLVESGLQKLKDDDLMRAYRTAEKKVKFTKQWRKDNPDKVAEQNKRQRSQKQKHYQHNKELYVNRQLQNAYGISLEEYQTLLESQNGVCAICGNECKSGKRLAVDHCHDTKKIRGLLCGKCNTALGLFDDDVHLLKKAMEYIL